MAGFIIWLDEQWRAWFKEVEHARVRDQYAPLRTSDHVAFDAWLEERTQ